MTRKEIIQLAINEIAEERKINKAEVTSIQVVNKLIDKLSEQVDPIKLIDEIIEKVESMKGLSGKMAMGEWSSKMIELLEQFKKESC